MPATNNGWPIVAESAVTRVYLGDDANGAQVLTGDVATAFTWLVEQIHARVERVVGVSGWRSQAFNTSVGGARGSNHMSGTAVDVNGFKHPYEAGTYDPAYGTGGWGASGVAEVRRILAEAGGLFAWGLDFAVGWRDAMHFDIAKGKTPTDVARFVATITQEDDMSVADVRTGLHGLLTEAATRSTPTGRQVGDALVAILDPLVTARVADVLDESKLVDAIVARIPTDAGILTKDDVRAAAKSAVRDVLKTTTLTAKVQ